MTKLDTQGRLENASRIRRFKLWRKYQAPRGGFAESEAQYLRGLFCEREALKHDDTDVKEKPWVGLQS